MSSIFKPFKYELKTYWHIIMWVGIASIVLNFEMLFFHNGDIVYGEIIVDKVIGYSPWVIIMCMVYPIREKANLDINRALFLNFKHSHLLLVKVISDIIKSTLMFFTLLFVVAFLVVVNGGIIEFTYSQLSNMFLFIFTYAGIALLVTTITRSTLRIDIKALRIFIYTLIIIFFVIVPLVARYLVLYDLGVQSWFDESTGFIEFLNDWKWLGFIPFINMLHLAGAIYGVVPGWIFIGPAMWGFITIFVLFPYYSRWNKEYLLM